MSDEPSAQSHEIIVPRTSRYMLLGDPVSGIEEVWLACHGYGQLASRFVQSFEGIAHGNRLIVAPEALSRFYLSGSAGPHSSEDKVGASWMTREGRDAEIADQVTYLDMVCARVFEWIPRGTARLVGFGFSQGAAAVCRWAARTADPPDHLILWGSGVPLDLLEGRMVSGLMRARLTIVIGSRDELVDAAAAEAHRAQLDGAGVSYRLLRYDGGHEIDPGNLARIIADLRVGDTHP